MSELIYFYLSGRVFKETHWQWERSWKVPRKDWDWHQFYWPQLPESVGTLFGWVCRQGGDWRSLHSQSSSSKVELLKLWKPSHHLKLWLFQVYNLLRLCELLVLSCKNLKQVYVLTGKEPGRQQEMLDELKQSLAKHNVVLEVEYSSTLHDREIRWFRYSKCPPIKRFVIGMWFACFL